MKLPFIAAFLVLIFLISFTVIISQDKAIPSEMLFGFSSIIAFLTGVISHNPIDKDKTE